MSKENKQTVEVYKKTAHLYLENSAEHDRLDPAKAEKKKAKLEKLITESFKGLPENAKVFEIGSGEGANAKFMKDLGYNITASDTADDFINATKAQGVNTIKFDVLEDEFKEKYHGAFCWRVFVHFTKEDALEVINKVYDALEENGVFIFNAINRELKEVDNEWVDFAGEYHMGVERYYNYYLKEDLDNIISKTNFKIKDFHTEGGESGNKWLVYVLEK